MTVAQITAAMELLDLEIIETGSIHCNTCTTHAWTQRMICVLDLSDDTCVRIRSLAVWQNCPRHELRSTSPRFTQRTLKSITPGGVVSTTGGEFKSVGVSR